MKLTPGTLKKGKIAKQAQDVFKLFKDCHPAERKAIEGMNKSELTSAIIGDAKISMPGLQAAQRKQKVAGKNEKNGSESAEKQKNSSGGQKKNGNSGGLKKKKN